MVQDEACSLALGALALLAPAAGSAQPLSTSASRRRRGGRVVIGGAPVYHVPVWRAPVYRAVYSGPVYRPVYVAPPVV